MIVVMRCLLGSTQFIALPLFLLLFDARCPRCVQFSFRPTGARRVPVAPTMDSEARHRLHPPSSRLAQPLQAVASTLVRPVPETCGPLPRLCLNARYSVRFTAVPREPHRSCHAKRQALPGRMSHHCLSSFLANAAVRASRAGKLIGDGDVSPSSRPATSTLRGPRRCLDGCGGDTCAACCIKDAEVFLGHGRGHAAWACTRGVRLPRALG
jgi:hypothetical protein